MSYDEGAVYGDSLRESARVGMCHYDGSGER